MVFKIVFLSLYRKLIICQLKSEHAVFRIIKMNICIVVKNLKTKSIHIIIGVYNKTIQGIIHLNCINMEHLINT